MNYPLLLLWRVARLFTLPVIVASISCPLAAQTPMVLELHGAFQVEEVVRTTFLTPHPVASADGRLLLGLGTSDVTGSGSPEISSNERRVETFPILTYLYYLLKYRDDVTTAEVDFLVNMIENHGLVMQEPFSPSIVGFEPRITPWGAHEPTTFTTAQMAVIDLMRALRFGTLIMANEWGVQCQQIRAV